MGAWCLHTKFEGDFAGFGETYRCVGSRPMAGRSLLRVSVLVALIVFSMAGCQSGAVRSAPVAPLDVDGLLFGLERCRSPNECPSGVCSAGMCVGFLTVSTELARMQVGEVMAGVHEPLRSGLVEALQSVLEDPGTSGVVRGRAADALRYLGGERALTLLTKHLSDPSQSVRFFTARALHLAGDPGGTRVLEGFKGHPAEAVRILAMMALDGQVGGGSNGPGQGDSRK